MHTALRFIRRRSLIAGLLLMFVYTWPIDLAHSGALPLHVPFPVYITLGWGFVFAALLVSGLSLGRAGALALLRRYAIWRVGWRWYLAALGLFPALFLAAASLTAALSRTPPDFSAAYAYRIFGAQARLPLLVLPFFLFEMLTNGEEMGWRGFVLPRLQAKYSALRASLILGLVWGFWHLPKFLAPGSSTPIAWFLLKMLAEAVLFTWLYNNTRGSLLLVTLFHAAGNTAGMFLPLSGSAYPAAVMLELLAAASVIAAAGPQSLSRSAPPQALHDRQAAQAAPAPGD